MGVWIYFPVEVCSATPVSVHLPTVRALFPICGGERQAGQVPVDGHLEADRGGRGPAHCSIAPPTISFAFFHCLVR